MVCPGLPRSEPECIAKQAHRGHLFHACMRGRAGAGPATSEPASEGGRRRSHASKQSEGVTKDCRDEVRAMPHITPASMPGSLWLSEGRCCCCCCCHRARGKETRQVDWNPARLNCMYGLEGVQEGVRKVSWDPGIHKAR